MADENTDKDQTDVKSSDQGAGGSVSEPTGTDGNSTSTGTNSTDANASGDDTSDPNNIPADDVSQGSDTDNQNQDDQTPPDDTGSDTTPENNDQADNTNAKTPPPDTNDLDGIDFTINEQLTLDALQTKEELRNFIDDFLASRQDDNDQDVRALVEFRNRCFNLVGVQTICEFLLQLDLKVELPAIVKRLTQQDPKNKGDSNE